MPASVFLQQPLIHEAVGFFTDTIKGQVRQWQEKPEPYDAQLSLAAARYCFDELRLFASFHELDVEKILAGDTELALACSVVALNPGG